MFLNKFIVNISKDVYINSTKLLGSTQDIEKTLSDLSMSLKRNFFELKEYQQNLSADLSQSLLNKKSQSIGSLFDLMQESNLPRFHNRLINKSLTRDFLYLYCDTTFKYRMIHPISFVAYKTTADDNDDEVFIAYEEEELVNNVAILKPEVKKSWRSNIDKTDSLFYLHENSIPIFPIFEFLDSNRKVHSKMKWKKVEVFVKDNNLADEFDIRDKIQEIINYLSVKEE